MSLQTLNQLENAIGGRPPLPSKKCRLSFYLNPDDALKLKAYAIEQDTTVSKIVRNLLNPLVSSL
jgi:hypothetical protein